MDPISDYFISYNNDITVKQEKLPDSEVSLNQYLPFNKNSRSVYPLMLVQSAQNILNQPDLAMKKPPQGNSTFPWKGKKPFKIIRTKREESSDSIEVKIEPEKKVMDNHRRELRREEAKKKFQRKLNSGSVASSDDLSSNYEAFLGGDMDEKTQRKMLQMIRNRISAQNSRDKRKAYVGTLEEAKEDLTRENRQLSRDKNKLIQEIQKLELANEMLLKERSLLLSNEEIPCMNCDDLTKNNDMVNFGVSLGLVIGSMLAGRPNLNVQDIKLPNNQLPVFDLRSMNVQALQSGRSVSLPYNQEETRLSMLRKCSKSTMASPTTSPLGEESFMSSYQNKPSFWESALDDNMTLEPKNFVSTAMQEEKEDVLDLHNFQGTLRGQESGKSLSITFPTASVMENILNGSSLSQKLTEFEKSGYLKLFNNQFPLSN